MPRRLMRRSMAPRRPLLFMEQWPLALTIAVVGLGLIALVAWAYLG